MIAPSLLTHHLMRTAPVIEPLGRDLPQRSTAPIVLRATRAEDSHALERLQALDGHRLPRSADLVAESGTQLLAALDTRSGVAVSDPFEPTAAALSLLRLRARQLAAF